VNVTVILYENSKMQATKNYKKGEGKGLKKEAYRWVNLIKVPYVHVINITMKPLCTNNLC
jgi:hypothetical protein